MRQFCRFNLLLWAIFSCLSACTATSQVPAPFHETPSQIVPVGGNAWLLNSTDKNEKITNDGLVQWNQLSTICRTYVRVSQAGKLKLSATLKGGASESEVQFTVLGKPFQVKIVPTTTQEYAIGEWEISQAGYVAIDAQGMRRSGNNFGDLQQFTLSGSALGGGTIFVKNNTDNYFYWGRRGPSVHLRYTLPANQNIEWFYSELTVPEKEDVIGSYYMANGFGEGYFGMQVNSPTERRVLFSVWSPFSTDNPNAIPDDQKIVMLKKGADVYTGEFGNEGSGGQSYLKYPWKAGNTYRFLLQGKPTTDNYTSYTAYFFAPEENQWRLIASFKRPKTNTYLKSLYSFLENFTPDTGNQSRMALYGNQWVWTSQNQWIELTEAKFTGDATARKNYRKDYAGGLSKGAFFLKNCGFFNDFVPLDGTFQRNAAKSPPAINFSSLP
ncbi:hypothetical protein FHS57_001080 [Runella defluvii]|uniref:DUF5077 domain-containing protein n=1 Tax=Runella defluvii TaxID=370973 RepID=A0A7W5ZJV0_9BACT|nr:DUF3472 domain-containing protein [Runella defluvii]MBB3837086.1 hypothetical protein [Runella defluvii]